MIIPLQSKRFIKFQQLKGSDILPAQGKIRPLCQEIGTNPEDLENHETKKVLTRGRTNHCGNIFLCDIEL